jgi:hypothetical protein
MTVLAFLIVSAASLPFEPDSESPKCSIQVRFGGPSPDVMYVHAVATGTRTFVTVDEDVGGRDRVLPDSAVAFELRVIQAMGGGEPPVPGDVIMVTPWDYRADCSRRAWDGPWIEADEEAVLTVRGGTLQEDESHYHVLGGLAAFPQGWWHAVHGGTYPDRGPGENWMSPGQFFGLLEALPSLDGLHRNDLRDAHERVIGVLQGGPASWSTMYPGTEILRTSENVLSVGQGADTQR